MMSNTSYTTQLAVFCVLASAAGIACPLPGCADRRAPLRSTRPLPARQARAGSIKLRFPRTENCSLAFSAVRHSQWAATLCYGMSGPPGVFGPGAAFPRLLCRTRPRTVSPPSRSPGSVFGPSRGCACSTTSRCPRPRPCRSNWHVVCKLTELGRRISQSMARSQSNSECAYFSSDDKYLAAVGSDSIRKCLEGPEWRASVAVFSERGHCQGRAFDTVIGVRPRQPLSCGRR